MSSNPLSTAKTTITRTHNHTGKNNVCFLEKIVSLLNVIFCQNILPFDNKKSHFEKNTRNQTFSHEFNAVSNEPL